jgi:hypothetical protein
VSDKIQVDRQEFLAKLVHETLACISIGELVHVRQLNEAAGDNWTKQQIEQIARKVVKSELDDNVTKILKRELKTKAIEDTITSIVSQALARYHEILFTRKSTWQNQLKTK